MYKSIKYRIYPNNKQVEIIKQTFGCCRKIWNLILEDKLRSIEDNKCTKNKLLCDYLKEYPYLNDVEFSALSNVKKNLLTIIKTTFPIDKRYHLKQNENKLQKTKIQRL